MAESDGSDIPDMPPQADLAPAEPGAPSPAPYAGYTMCLACALQQGNSESQSIQPVPVEACPWYLAADEALHLIIIRD